MNIHHNIELLYKDAEFLKWCEEQDQKDLDFQLRQDMEDEYYLSYIDGHYERSGRR